MIQFGTGHNNFKAKLTKFNLVEDTDCQSFKMEETAGHMLIEYEEERRGLWELVERMEI